MYVSDMFTTVRGFRVGVADAGIRKNPAPDLTLIAAEQPCAAAALFTTNKVQAAPVILSRERLDQHSERIHALLINAGCANACTGEPGYKNAWQSAAWAALEVGCLPDEVLVMSTGVIGVQLPMEKMRAGISAAGRTFRAEAWPEAARAIMTTDTRPKMAHIETGGYTVAGIAKGAGMIAPNMATMLAAIVTDAQIGAFELYKALRHANARSFNRITIDGDMSTNDTIAVLASGASGAAVEHLDEFTTALTAVCQSLARQIVLDGEGATKFIEIRVTGAESDGDARQIANTIATSPLVKTAFYGGDANWGRILAAAGRAGAAVTPERMALWYDNLQLVAEGTPLPYDEARANAIAGQKNITVRLDLGLGDGESTVWTCDLSHDYVSINGHYRT